MDFFSGIFAFTLFYSIVNGVVMYFVIGYFDPQRASKERALMSAAIVAPYVLALLPLAMLSSALTFQTLPFVSLASPVAAFLLLWLALKVPVKRAALFIAGYYVISFVTRAVLGITGALLRAILGDSLAAGSWSVLLLALAVAVTVTWLAARTFAGRRLPIVAGSSGFALLLAPVLVVGHGVGIVPAFMAWPLVFDGGSDGAIMLMFIVPSVLITGTLLVVICRLVQRLRTPASEVDGDRQA